MQKHWKIVTGCLVIFLSCAVITALLQSTKSPYPPEPRYQGKTLSEWMCPSKKPATWGMGAWGPHREAIQHIGTNAIPFAIRWMQYQEPAGQYDAYKDRNRSLAIASVDVFEILGTKASGSVKELTRLINNTNQSDWVKGCATRSLAYLGPDGYPPLIATLTNEQFSLQLRDYAAIDIARNGRNTNAIPAIPSLINALSNTNAHFAAECALSLGHIGLEDKTVVPALIEKLGDPRPEVRRWAAVGLGCYGTNAKSAIPALQALLNDPVNSSRYDITNAILNIEGHN